MAKAEIIKMLCDQRGQINVLPLKRLHGWRGLSTVKGDVAS